MSNTVHIDTCPVCSGTAMELAHTCKDHYATGETFEIAKCASCGFLFTQDFPSEENIGRYYDTQEYISHSNTQKGLVNRLYHLVRKRMLGKKAALVRKHNRSGSAWLLDIGCGTGFFLSEIAKKGWSVKGVEKNKSARDFASKHFGIIADTPEMLHQYEELSFGVVTLWHVLEHLEDLNGMLKRIHKLLVENGTVFIAVPNVASVDATHYKEYWAALDVPRHLWHFTPDTMKRLVENNGFGIEAMYPMPFDAFYVSMLSEKYTQSRFGFLKGFWRGLTAYFKSCGKTERSSSVIYVLKKTEMLRFKL